MKLSVISARLFSLAFAVISLPGTATAQATHIITVGDNFFSPANVTLQVGDTVEWRNAAGGNSHNVTASNGSFSSGTSSSFTFSRTFNTAGSVPYECTLHTNMNGTITVEAAAASFLFNAGLNDAWSDPGTDKQGFFVTVFPDIGKVFVAWFTYDIERPAGGVEAQLGEPGHRWLTAFGDYSGDTAVLDIELTEGGIFAENPPNPIQTPGYGTLTLRFSDCNSGEVEYTIPSLNQSGTIPIQRVALDNVPLCEALQTP